MFGRMGIVSGPTKRLIIFNIEFQNFVDELIGSGSGVSR
ncbi:MAG: hypothetical protein ACI9UU_001410 [Candidatus Azotimanducaceae bacterium]|jgi:hypothetical protein